MRRINVQSQSRGSSVKAVNTSRANYNEIHSRFKGKIVTQSYLRLERNISGSITTVDFLTLVNEGNQLASERRLNLPDAFVVTSVGMYISKIASDTPANQATKILRSFPNAQVFSGSGEAGNLMGLYNGFLSLRINSTVFIDSLPGYEFYDSGNYQQGVGSSATSNVPVQRDQFSGLQTGYKAITPTVTLDGSTKIQWQLALPAPIDVSGTSSVNTIALILKGFLVQNGSSINNFSR